MDISEKLGQLRKMTEDRHRKNEDDWPKCRQFIRNSLGTIAAQNADQLKLAEEGASAVSLVFVPEFIFEQQVQSRALLTFAQDYFLGNVRVVYRPSIRRHEAERDASKEFIDRQLEKSEIVGSFDYSKVHRGLVDDFVSKFLDRIVKDHWTVRR